MIKQLMRIPVYFCVATCIAEVIYLGVLASKGGLGQEQISDITAVVYGVDRETILAHYERYRIEEFVEPVDLEAIDNQTKLDHLNLDLRESAIAKATIDLSYYDDNLRQERDRYDELRLAFEEQVQHIDVSSSSRDVVELSRTLQAMTPAQAKDQMIRLFELSKTSVDEEIANDAVAIIRTMPIDKQKKIIGEFKTEQEKERLGEILRMIRTGVPEVPLIQRTRDQLQQFDPRKPEPET